jgi:hypothetical protein
MNNNPLTGVEYTTTGDRHRGIVCDYHHKPSPLTLNKSKSKVDISGLKKKEQATLIIPERDYFSNELEYVTKYTIGFEIEKNQFHRGAVREYELFCGFERDRSCGYEAVTHVLPLLPASAWRNKVFDMVYKAKRIIEDSHSPSDQRCGGHISIGVNGKSGDEIIQMVRYNCGILLALFRHRLRNHYCCINKRMNAGYREKYSVANIKGNCLEFRIPSRVESVKQLMRRYELMYEIVKFSDEHNGQTTQREHDRLLKKIRPIVLSMYNGDEEACEKILDYARKFREYIVNGEVHESIARFV